MSVVTGNAVVRELKPAAPAIAALGGSLLAGEEGAAG
jgi:hypothetical protein